MTRAFSDTAIDDEFPVAPPAGLRVNSGFVGWSVPGPGAAVANPSVAATVQAFGMLKIGFQP
jgi:hypothetical protein